MTLILQRCRNTGRLAEDCGGNFACEYSCDLEDFEVVPVTLADRYKAALEEIAKVYVDLSLEADEALDRADLIVTEALREDAA